MPPILVQVCTELERLSCLGHMGDVEVACALALRDIVFSSERAWK